MNIEHLKSACERAGFQIMSDEEMTDWLNKSKAYQDSPEGKIEADETEIQLDYLLERAKYKFTSEMGEISGFGGSYEKGCRVMLDVGLRWLDDNPNAQPKFHGFKGVYGMIDEDNEDAKTFSKIVSKSVQGCSGAMHHAVISRCLWIKSNGWDKYVEKMSEPETVQETS